MVEDYTSLNNKIQLPLKSTKERSIEDVTQHITNHTLRNITQMDQKDKKTIIQQIIQGDIKNQKKQKR